MHRRGALIGGPSLPTYYVVAPFPYPVQETGLCGKPVMLGLEGLLRTGLLVIAGTAQLGHREDVMRPLLTVATYASISILAVTVACSIATAQMMGPGGPMMGHGMMGGGSGKTEFASNGERIYDTGVSAKTGPIRSSGGPMWVQMHGAGCVTCHGLHGRGGVPVMMGSAIPPDIRYKALTSGEYEQGEKGTPYTDALIKRAITEGLDADGKPLDRTMPRWSMEEADLNDLIAYLKTLH